jgi:hypothetical protein
MLQALYSTEISFMPSMDTIRKQKWRPTFLRSSLRGNNAAGFEKEEKKESSEDSTASENKDTVVVDPSENKDAVVVDSSHIVVPSDVRKLQCSQPSRCCESIKGTILTIFLILNLQLLFIRTYVCMYRTAVLSKSCFYRQMRVVVTKPRLRRSPNSSKSTFLGPYAKASIWKKL